jgi:hypothetical protein
MGKLVINLKKEIKQEIMAEVGKETTKMRNEYNAKILNMGGRIDVLEFDNIFTCKISLMSFFRRRRAILDSILRNLINIGLGATGLPGIIVVFQRTCLWNG